MVGKRAWIRLLEATIAIMIIGGVLLISYTSRPQAKTELSEKYIRDLEIKALKDISTNKSLQKEVFKANHPKIDSMLSELFPSSIGFELRICDIEKISCKLSAKNVKKTLEKNVFVEDTIIATDFQSFKPKKVRIFAWQNR